MAPSVQYLRASYMVSLLHALDGGTLYGMQYD